MRSYLFVALLAITLCFSADARQLAQEALSNSNGCLPTIPMCQEGACATTMLPGGTAGYKCLRCRGNYDPVIDSADNIIQCGEWDRPGPPCELAQPQSVGTCKTHIVLVHALQKHAVPLHTLSIIVSGTFSDSHVYPLCQHSLPPCCHATHSAIQEVVQQSASAKCCC
jgi:hypothetical protein